MSLDKSEKQPRSMGDSMLDTAFTSVVVILITLATGVVLARLLGPEGRGYYGAVQFWGQIAASTLTTALYEALVVRLRTRGDAPESAVSLSLLIALVLLPIAAFVALAAYSTGALNIPVLGSVLSVGIFLLIAATRMVNLAFGTIESAGLSFYRLNFERTVSPTLFLLAALALYFLGCASVLTVLIAFVVTMLPVIIIRVVRFRRHLFGQVDRILVREVTRLAPRYFVSSGTMSLAMHIDRVIVTSIWSAESLGFYFVAFTAAGAGLAIASQAIRMTLLPSLAGLPLLERREKTERLFRLSLVAAITVSVPVFVMASMLVPLIYGSEFTPAVGYVKGMMAAMVLLPTLQIVEIANRARERGQPGLEMALGIVTVYFIGYVLTGLTQPTALFVTVACANFAGIAIGLRHLVKDGSVRLNWSLIPSSTDFLFLINSATRHANAALKQVCFGSGGKIH